MTVASRLVSRPASILTAALLGLVAPSASARPRPFSPGRGPTPGQHLRQAPIERALPGPGRVAVGRFLSTLHGARGPRAGARVGDYFVRTTELLAVLRADTGGLVDLAPGPGFVDGVGWGQVQICQGQNRHSPQLEGISLVGGTRPSVEVRSRLPALGLELRSRYHVPPAGHRLEIESELHNLGKRVVEDVALCEELGLGNTRLQVAGVGEVRQARALGGLFAARREAGVSYLLMRLDGKSLQLPLEESHPPQAFDPQLRVEYERGRLQPGERRLASRLLVVRSGPLHAALAEALAASSLPTRRATVELDQDPLLQGAPPTLLRVRRDGKPFLLTQAARRVELTLPRQGRYSVALLVPGAGEGTTVPLVSPEATRPRLPALSTLVAGLSDAAGEPLPGRLVILGRDGTPAPAFGSDEGLRLENVVYLGAGPEKLLLAPGSYRLRATRGPQYGVAEASLRLVAGETRRLSLKLRQVVRAPGWLSADLHQHTTSSFDSPLRPAERVLSAAALGLDLLVLTDHNVITAPPVVTARPGSRPAAPAPRTAAAPLLSPLVVAGEEVTSYGHLIGHFNVFPLALGQEIVARDTSPAQLFAEARRRPGAPLIQVNHPRMGSIGYFDQMQLDAASGRAAAAYHPGFDLLEVLNGDDLDRLEAVDRVLRDWYQLLNRGLRYVATAGSDAHRLPFQESGSPRTLILWDPSEKGGAPTEALALAALRAGRAVASSGPFVHFSLDGKPIGSLIKGGRPLQLRLRVEAPAWMSVSTATLIANGTPLQTFRARKGEPVRLEVSRTLKPTSDTWYVVVVRGEQEDPTLLRRGVLPFAVSNPIFVDVDGDGRCLPAAGAAATSRPAGTPEQ